MSVSYGGDSITFADGSVTSSGWTGFKNRIINGAITIDQRYAGAGNTLVTGVETFVVDRFVAYKDAAVITSGQSSVAPPGFKNSLSWSVGTGAAATTNQYRFIKQHIEGFNTADLDFGTANAKPVTISFWVRASITGTYSGSINNGAADRSCGFTYTINSTDTWEYKTVTVSGDTSGTWVGATNGIGLRVYWDMGGHSSIRNSSAGVWGSGALVGVAGTTSISATTGATFYITGVQLERGSTASSFEWRPYTTELQLCQRYYWTGDSSMYGYYGFGGNVPEGSFISFPVQMRIAPTITFGTVVTYNYTNASYSALISPNGYFYYANVTATATAYRVTPTYATAEL